MLKALFRTRLAALASWLTGSSRTKKAQGKGRLIGFSLLMLYALGALGLLFWQIFGGVALPFHAAGLDWLYFALTALMSFALMFVGSVFTAKAQLYEARDNDLLLSMPIRPSYILLSRMFMLGLLSFVFGLIPAVPAGGHAAAAPSAGCRIRSHRVNPAGPVHLLVAGKPGQGSPPHRIR